MIDIHRRILERKLIDTEDDLALKLLTAFIGRIEANLPAWNVGKPRQLTKTHRITDNYRLWRASPTNRQGIRQSFSITFTASSLIRAYSCRSYSVINSQTFGFDPNYRCRTARSLTRLRTEAYPRL